MIASVVRFVTGIAAHQVSAWRAWATLIALAAAAGWLYVEYATISAQRDRYAHWIDTTCAASGSRWAVTPPAARGVQPGDQCAARVAALAEFERSTAVASARALAAAMLEHDGKSNRDAASARTAAEAARDATQRMEAANAEVRGTRVDGPWFDALNSAAGLQPPPR